MPSAQNVPVETLPEPSAIAAYELVAAVLRERSTELIIALLNLTDDGASVGSFSISIRKTDETNIASAA